MRETVTEIEKTYQTGGSHPVLVRCDDFEYYVLKYKSGSDAYNLAREYIAASFLKIWELSVPDFDLVKVNREHIPAFLPYGIQPHFFDAVCFGSKFSRNYVDFTELAGFYPNNFIQQFVYKNELLEIALFDVWISNEDRNANNANLMYDLSNGNRFVPIDHQYIFNSSSLNHDLTLLTFWDSILSYPTTKSFFKKRELTNTALIDDLNEKYYLCISNCKEQLDNIIESIPVDWNIDKETFTERINNQLFSEEWIGKVMEEFITILQQLTNRY